MKTIAAPLRAFAALAVFLLAAGSAHAQAPAGAPPAAGAADGRPPWVIACDGDMKKHCAAEMKGDVRPCLAKHEADLSTSCKDVFLRKYKILELCKGDIDKLCGGTTDGKALGKCMNDKQAELSEKCRGALTKGNKQHEKQEAAAAAKAEKTDKKVAAKKKPAAE